jgi:hypothetical protein
LKYGLYSKYEGQKIDKDRAMRLWPWDWAPKAKDDFDMRVKQPDWVNDVHNVYKGEDAPSRMFMFGSGPSLVSQIDLLPQMEQEMTWTVNRIAKWKELPFIPKHHSIAEPGPVVGWGKRIHAQYDFPTVKNRIAIHWVEIPERTGWKWCAKAHDDIQIRWQGFQGLGDYLPPLPTGWASPITSSQLAAWMGFDEIYFLGMDTTQEGQAYDVQRGRTARKRSILSILECADRMKVQMEHAGRKVIDCTPGGLINKEGVWEYAELGDVLASRSTVWSY